jgi:hypothetical protein
MRTKKKFDCVEMMHKGAERVRRKVQGMSREQEAEYWRQRTEELRKMKDQVTERRKAS